MRPRRGDNTRINALAITPALAARFWAKVDIRRPDECWRWKAALHVQGYGLFCAFPRVGNANAMATAHRVAFRLHHGPIPHGLDVLHSCDNTPCCNPAHLSAGTPGRNMQEVFDRGRRRDVVMTPEGVYEMRCLRKWFSMKWTHLARASGLKSSGGPQNICEGKSWSWVAHPPDEPDYPPELLERLLRGD